MQACLDANISYSLPAEWTPQSAVMLTWPHRDTIWANSLPAIDDVFVAVAREIALREKVVITCVDKAHEQHVKTLLHSAGVASHQVAIYLAHSNDIWVRDHGPIAVNKPQLTLLDFTFNAWGNKYPSESDNQITSLLHAQQAFGATPRMKVDLVLEGGGIEVDGQGCLLTTSHCLLSKTRNPHLSKTQITTTLSQWLGIKKIHWLDHGYLAGDDTDSHIDTLARFTDAHTIVYTACDDSSDEHFSELQAMQEQLRSFTDYRNQPYQLIPLPWPKPHYADVDGRRLPASYCNFLIINGAVLVPTYNDPADAEALRILAACFKDRQIIGIDCVPVIQWYGSLHCMTMQLPQGVVL